jgi:hypothetical protein
VLSAHKVSSVPLRLDQATVADVERFAGTPDFTGSGTFEASNPNYPSDYFALGYECSTPRRLGIDPGARRPWGRNCRTAYFFVSPNSTLSAFWTHSPHFRTPGGTLPGMRQSAADRREKTFARLGCWTGIWRSTPGAILFLENTGGSPKKGSKPGRLVGGKVGAFYLESNRRPVGLLSC